MYRNDACALLSMIASDELIDYTVSREIIKARDIVVCDHHKVLDVLASDEARSIYRKELRHILYDLSESKYIQMETRKKARALWADLMANPESDIEFYEKCKEPFIKTRCKDCPNLKK